MLPSNRLCQSKRGRFLDSHLESHDRCPAYCSVEAELTLLRSQLERQQAAAAEQQAAHADALTQLNSSR